VYRPLTAHLRACGWRIEELLAAGLTRRAPDGHYYDTFRDRIMIALHNADGDPVGFTGRAIQSTDRIPKYLNTAATPIFRKAQILYGVTEQADRLAAGATTVLVEGPLDVLAVWLAHQDRDVDDGDRVAVATCSTRLSDAHVGALLGMPGVARHGVILAYDADPVGMAATERAWDLLHPRGVLLLATALPAGADPADLISTRSGVTFLRAVLDQPRPAVHALIDHRLRTYYDAHRDWPDCAELHVGAVHAVVCSSTSRHTIWTTSSTTLHIWLKPVLTWSSPPSTHTGANTPATNGETNHHRWLRSAHDATLCGRTTLVQIGHFASTSGATCSGVSSCSNHAVKYDHSQSAPTAAGMRSEASKRNVAFWSVSNFAESRSIGSV
jgi:hypothetical protein